MNVENLKSARKRSGMTQIEVADKLGISRNTYKNYEQGTREPNGDTIVALAILFHETTDYLLGKEESVSSDDPIVALCEACNFNMIERAIITAYCAMNGKQRKNFMDQISQFSKMVHNACSETVQVVLEEQSEEPSQPIVQEQATQEVANDTEQPTYEEQQFDDATVQEETTQQTITHEQDSPEEGQSESPIRISQEPTIQPGEAEVHIKHNVAMRKDIKKKASRNGEKPFVRVLTEAQKDEIRSRPRADEDM